MQRKFLLSDDDVERVLEGFHPDDLSDLRPWWVLQNGVDESTDTIVTRPIVETLVAKTGGMTALLHAAREGRVEAVEALLDGGADIDQDSARPQGCLPRARQVERPLRSRPRS